MMSKIICGYCGNEYDETYGGALDNGSPACPECVEDEEKWERENEVQGNEE